MKKSFFYLTILCFQLLYGYANNPPNARTGAPGQSTCASGNCHNSYSLNSGSGQIQVIGPITYNPGEILTYIISINQNGMERWGFELCSLTDNLIQGGEILISDGINTQVSSSSEIIYIKQTNSGTYNGQSNTAQWEFQWQTPQELIGDVTFYFTGNAANANGQRSGDYIYASFISIEENQQNNCDPNGDVNLDDIVNILDVISIISYVLNTTEFTNIQLCYSDINIDNTVDILDIVLIINIILN